ncbi:MAG: hypothetical protein HQL82_11635 [Magnetococcales bacterium]|nr:hypothetical protein [Magnetococcales bacterium]
MKTFEEIIQFAIRHEEQEIAFYRNLATRSPNQDQKNALLAQVNEEMAQKKMLEQMLASHDLPRGEARYYRAPKEMHLESQFQPKNESSEPLSYEDALLLSIDMERKAEQLYREMADHMAMFNKGLAKTLRYLAEQQGKHRSHMEANFDDAMKEN